MEIKVSKIKEKPTNMPEVKTDDPICKEDTSSDTKKIFRSSTCDEHFTGNTNGSGQALIFESGSFVDVLKRNTEYTIATVTIDGSPVENALLDGNIKYATESTGMDTGSSNILSAIIHARTADGSKEATLNWP